VLLISLLGAAAMTFPQAVTDSFPLFLAERFAVGLFVGGVVPTLNALVGRSSEPSERSAVFGVMSSATFLGGFLGPLTGGALAAMMGLPAAFVSTAVLMLAAYAWVLKAVRKDAGEGATATP
jgi:DHA1 family multidrug resistance protein-like MFS transporter